VLPGTAREFAAGISGAELIEYPAAGHIFTPPEAERRAGDVAAFLDRSSAVAFRLGSMSEPLALGA
jgi:hypothetical protein